MSATIDRHFRFTPELDAILDQIIAYHGIDRTAVIKSLLMGHARELNLIPPVEAPKKSKKKSA